MKCQYCANAITEENISREHIIPASLGGKLASNKILCRSCNNKFGAEIDNELFIQLKFASVYLGFSGKNNSKMQTMDGEEIVVGMGLAPFSRGTIFIPNSNDKKFIWDKKANNVSKILKDNLKKVQTKYPDLSLRIEEYTKINKNKQFYFIQENAKAPGFIQFGGEEYFKAISKMSIGFAVYHDVASHYLQQAVNMVKNNGTVTCGYYYPITYSVRKKPSEEISHLLYLKGEPSKKLLYVYSELFSFCNHLCILSTDYEGEEIEKLYHYDLLDKQQIDNSSISIKLTKAFASDGQIILRSMFKNNQKQQHADFVNLMNIIEKRQLEIQNI